MLTECGRGGKGPQRLINCRHIEKGKGLQLTIVDENNERFQLLVVDDEFDNREVLARRFKKRGYRVLDAEDGQLALELVEREPIDLVLLDINMPGMDGLEVLRRLRTLYTPMELPVIMQTARAGEEDQVETASLGANDHVVKPVKFKIVEAKVKALLKAKTAADSTRLSAAPTEIREGAEIDGKYRLEQQIGSGTFGTVYRARHLRLEQDVAIKFLQPSVTATAESQRRFQQEGVATGKVKHPNAVAVTDFGVTRDGVAYLVMELLNGFSLAQELKEQGQLSPHRVGQLLRPICDVLAEAHRAGLVHRDIKPENIFLHITRQGEVVKVLDFGIAKLVGENVTEQNLTAEGWVLGTPAYMAPERVANRGYDGRADIYSLGVMVYEMLAGRRPFVAVDSDPMGMIMRHVRDPAPPLGTLWPEATPAIQKAVHWTLEKNPDNRPGAAEFLAAYEAALLEDPPALPSGTTPVVDDVPFIAPTVGSPGVSTGRTKGSRGSGGAVDASAPTISIRKPESEPESPPQPPAEPKGWFDRLVDKFKEPFSK